MAPPKGEKGAARRLKDPIEPPPGSRSDRSAQTGHGSPGSQIPRATASPRLRSDPKGKRPVVKPTEPAESSTSRPPVIDSTDEEVLGNTKVPHQNLYFPTGMLEKT